MTENYTQQESALADHLFEQNYDELMIIARARRRRANGHQTLATIDLLHESYLKLNTARKWESREHFINATALAIRHVIIDYARRKNTAKRHQKLVPMTFDGDFAVMPEFWESSEQLIQISDLMRQLENLNPRWMRVVDARYFCGLTEDETATALKLSARTVRRDWQNARMWMAEKLGLQQT